jgi:hypothetical protein
VKVNLVDRDVVDLRFGTAQQFEGTDGGLLDRRGERGVLDLLANP